MESNTLIRPRRRSHNLTLLASLVIAAAARAGTPAQKLMLAGYVDTPAGQALLAGEYRSVIQRLGSHGAAYAGDETAGSTNLCVAYIMTRQWTEAHAACDRAIASAKADQFEGGLWALQQRDEQVALAYSNRAVLHRLEDDATGAASDLAMARELAPQAQFVSHNVVAFAASKSASVQSVAVGTQR